MCIVWWAGSNDPQNTGGSVREQMVVHDEDAKVALHMIHIRCCTVNIQNSNVFKASDKDNERKEPKPSIAHIAKSCPL